MAWVSVGFSQPVHVVGLIEAAEVLGVTQPGLLPGGAEGTEVLSTLLLPDPMRQCLPGSGEAACLLSRASMQTGHDRA
jgi:hypothetical protein